MDPKNPYFALAVEILRLGLDDVLWFLLESKKLKPNEVEDNRKNTLLHYAAAFNRSKMVQALVRNGWFVNAVNRFGDTSLHEATTANENMVETVKVLLRHGADPTIVKPCSCGDCSRTYTPAQQMKAYVYSTLGSEFATRAEQFAEVYNLLLEAENRFAAGL